MLVFVVGRVGETGIEIGKGGPCLNGDQVACVFCKLGLLLSFFFFVFFPLVTDQHRFPGKEAVFTLSFKIY